MKRQYYLLFIACFFLFNSCNKNITKKDSKTETEEELIERALKIHRKVLTLDTHTDTPLRMIIVTRWLEPSQIGRFVKCILDAIE